MLGGMAAE